MVLVNSVRTLQIDILHCTQFLFIVVSSFSAHSYNEMTGSMDSGYPRSIKSDFPGIGDEIDAATYQYGMEPYISPFQ